MAKLNVGIIGLGDIGAAHARALHHLDGAALVAYSGGSPDRAAACGWPDAEAHSPEGLLARTDLAAVVICSPSATHAALAMQSVERGIPVLVEKPLTVTTAEANALHAAARERSVPVLMVAQRRFEPAVVALKELLEAGALGEVRLVSAQVHWHRDDAYYAASPWRADAAGGGSVINQGVHTVDLLHWLCGEVDAVTAQSATLGHEGTAEDTTVATLRFASGALGVLSTSTATPPGAAATLTIATSLGTVQLGQGEITRWDMPGVPPPTFTGGIETGASDPTAIGLDGHIAVWRDFARTIAGADSHASAERALPTVQLMQALRVAARSGATVAVRSVS